jgi:hypothetical protein
VVKQVESGSSVDNALIAIEIGAPAVIDDTIEISKIDYGLVDNGAGVTTAVEAAIADALVAIAEDSPAKIADNPGDIATLFNGTATSVTYTGDTTSGLGAITASDKALIIAGEVSGQTATISVGTLEIADGAKLETTETITADTVTNNGTLTLGGTSKVSEVAESLINNGELTVNDSATLTVAAEAKLTVASGAKVEVASGGELDLSALVGGSVTLSGSGSQIEVSGTLKLPAPKTTSGSTQYEVTQINYGSSAIKINAGGKVYMNSTDNSSNEDYYIGPASTGAKYEWGTAGTPSVEFKADGEMALTGNLTSADDNAINTKVTINTEAKLTVKDGTTLTVGSTGNLVNEGTIDLGTNGSISGYSKVTNTNGTIQTADADGSTLVALLTAGTGVAAGTVEVSGEVALPADADVEVADGVELKVADTHSLTIPGDSNPGTLTVSGTLTVEGDITVEGTLIHAASSTAELNGTITVEATGIYKDLNSGGGTVWGTDAGGKDGGSITFEKGAKAYVGNETVAMISDVAPADGALVLIQLEETETTFKLEKAKYTLNGDAVVHGEFWVDAGIEIALEEDSSLTVSVSWWAASSEPAKDYPGLWLNGAGATITGATGAEIIVSGATVAPNTRNALYLKPAATNNFYDENGALITSSPNTIVGEGTYEWNTDADGDDGAGWKKDA